jgi:recombination protein RecA
MNELEAAFSYNDPLPVRSIEWIQQEMAKRQLAPLVKASELEKIEFITTGIPELDAILQPTGTKAPGGFPVGRVTEIYGLQGVGKTSLTLMSIAGLQKAGKKVLFIDVENALNTTRAMEFGVDLENLTVSNEVTVEGVGETVEAYASAFDVIVVDSLAAMVPAAEYEGDAGEAHMGLKARLMGQFMRKSVKRIADEKCALIFINQVRESLEMFSAKYFTPGGKAVPFATSLRIELKTLSKDKLEKTVKGTKSRVGQKVTATVTKTKVSKPYATAQFDLFY